MVLQRIKNYLCWASLLPIVATAAPVQYFPTDQRLYDLYPWSIMYYYGQTTNTSLAQLFIGNWRRWPEHIQSIEVGYTLSPQNFLRRFLNPIVGVVGVAGNATIRYGKNENTIYEFDPCLTFRWANFPWNQHLTTSFALAEGISYDTSVPAVEKKHNSNTKRLLNYLFVEATFAPPTQPRLQLLARIHHRSGAFGLYGAGNSGSNVIGLGLRYLFD